jgi:hypothetical protein
VWFVFGNLLSCILVLTDETFGCTIQLEMFADQSAIHAERQMPLIGIDTPGLP